MEENKNSTPLSELAIRYDVPFTGSFGEIPAPEGEEAIVRLMAEQYERYGDSIILYGGQTATEELLGVTKLRDITTDIDYLCTDEGLIKVLEGEELFYHEKYDILFNYRDHINVSYSYQHIHEWQVDRGFFATALQILLGAHPILCTSSEYSIMLKLCRMHCCRKTGRDLFGKDGIDIINLLLGPAYRQELPELDLGLLSGIIRDYVSKDREELEEFLSFIDRYSQHLPKRFHSLYSRVFAGFRASLLECGESV